MHTIHAQIATFAYHLPEHVIDNLELAALYPGWTAAKIQDKTGVRQRHVAAADETAADLAFAAAIKLFSMGNLKPSDVDVRDILLPDARLLPAEFLLRIASSARIA